MSMYLPEAEPYLRYNNGIGRFRTKIDGHPCETAFSGAIHDPYPPSINTVFDPEYRSSTAQNFGNLFYMSSLRNQLHKDLKHAFTEDMVTNKSLWEKEYKLGKSDLLTEDRTIYEEIESKLFTKEQITSGMAETLSTVGLLSQLKSCNAKYII